MEETPLVEKMASHCTMRIQTAPLNKNEIISTINALKRNIAAGLLGMFIVHYCQKSWGKMVKEENKQPQ